MEETSAGVDDKQRSGAAGGHEECIVPKNYFEFRHGGWTEASAGGHRFPCTPSLLPDTAAKQTRPVEKTTGKANKCV